MLTLTYGYKKPQSGDRGPTVFPALEDNIQQLNDHNHDGSNSSKLSAASLGVTTQSILAANWVSLGGGNFHQQVALLPGFDYDIVTLSFRDASGNYVNPTVTRVSNTVVDVTTNDGASNMTMVYGI